MSRHMCKLCVKISIFLHNLFKKVLAALRLTYTDIKYNGIMLGVVPNNIKYSITITERRGKKKIKKNILTQRTSKLQCTLKNPVYIFIYIYI